MKTKYFALLILGLVLLFNSCNRDDEPTFTVAPYLDLVIEEGFATGNVAAEPDDTVMYKVRVSKGDHPISTLTKMLGNYISSDDFGYTIQEIDTINQYDSIPEQTEFTSIFTIIPKYENHNNIVRFLAQDNLGNERNLEFSLIVPFVGDSLHLVNDTIFNKAQELLFYSIKDDSVFNAIEAANRQADIDFILAYGNQNTYICAPDDALMQEGGLFAYCQNWSDLNNTRFIEDTNSFNDLPYATYLMQNNITNSHLILKQGATITFLRANGDKGVLYVHNLFGATTEELKLSIKVKKY